MANWQQLLTAGAIGAAATWLGALVKTGFEHLLEQRKERAQKERVIRAEKREEERKQTERKQAQTEQWKKDEDVLIMYKTQLRGATELDTASNVLSGIHDFFIQRPQYLTAANRTFLEKYPGDFGTQISFAPHLVAPNTLSELKREVESLQLHAD